MQCRRQCPRPSYDQNQALWGLQDLVATRFGDRFRIFRDLLKPWALTICIQYTFVGELGLCFPLTISLELFPCNRMNLFQGLPCAVFVIEAIPLAEVLIFALGAVAVRNYTFDCLVKFEVLFLRSLSKSSVSHSSEVRPGAASRA